MTMIRFYVFPIIMDLLVQAKRCFDFFIFISKSHFSYLLFTIHVMDVTIDYLTTWQVENMSSLVKIALIDLEIQW